MKLIVCDLDGTLLDKNETKLNFGVTSVLRKFDGKNYIFAVASGRNYVELKALFRGFPGIYLITDDGAQIVHEEESIFESNFTQSQLSFFDKNFIAHGKYMNFIKCDNQFLKREFAHKYEGHIAFIDSVSEIDRKIFKVTVINPTNKFPFYEVYKNKNISEYIPLGVSKGSAVNFLMEKLSVSENNCFVFGDNYNDISMLFNQKNSYAMKHAPRPVKEVSEYVSENIIDDLQKIYRRYCDGSLQG